MGAVVRPRNDARRGYVSPPLTRGRQIRRANQARLLKNGVRVNFDDNGRKIDSDPNLMQLIQARWLAKNASVRDQASSAASRL